MVSNACGDKRLVPQLQWVYMWLETKDKAKDDKRRDRHWYDTDIRDTTAKRHEQDKKEKGHNDNGPQ